MAPTVPRSIVANRMVGRAEIVDLAWLLHVQGRELCLWASGCSLLQRAATYLGNAGTQV